jgi:Ca2+-binding RTX toxin-like protein
MAYFREGSMATWTVAETADAKFDIETFFSLNGMVLPTGEGQPDIIYYRSSQSETTYYVIHATKEDFNQNVYVSMEFLTHPDSGEDQLHATLSDIEISSAQFNTLTSNDTGAAVASVLFEGDDTLTGSSKDDILRGYAGKDVLDGAGGADNLYGGDGDDTYIVDDPGDVVMELKNQGIDIVKASVDFTLSAFVESLTLTGSDDLSGTGNTLANKITGNSGANLLQGLGGADAINGGKGDDSIYGGTGLDGLTGGKGADSFFFELGDTGAGKKTADTITDFHAAEGDRIELHAIDADTGSKGNQDFTFIGSAAFHHKAGELRFDKTSSDTWIYGDTNGDGKADLAIHLDHGIAMKADYFDL